MLISRKWSWFGLLVVLAAYLLPASVNAASVPPMQATWMRTDQPVAEHVVDRTWMWGPQEIAYGATEPYREASDGEREVVYYDKARMEVTHPDANPGSIWYVTNGLLVVELVSGQMQTGDAEFVDRQPADINVAGDPGSGPSYADLAALLDAPPAPDGAPIVQRLDADGGVSTDPALASRGVTAAYHVAISGQDHQVASPFWAFMNSSGLVYDEGDVHEAVLFENPFYATGYPITEAYWTRVNVAGAPRDVLLQCFERRCLTYTPTNQAGWQVEAGNVGLHYYAWRYGEPRRAPPTESVTFNVYFDGALVAKTITQETFLNNVAVGTWTTQDTGGVELSRGSLVADHLAGMIVASIVQKWPFDGNGTLTFEYQITISGLTGTGHLDYTANRSGGMETGSVTFAAESDSFDVDEWDIYLDALPPVLFGGGSEIGG